MSSIPSSKMPHAVAKPATVDDANNNQTPASAAPRLIPVGLVAAGAAILGVVAAATVGAVQARSRGSDKGKRGNAKRGSRKR